VHAMADVQTHEAHKARVKRRRDGERDRKRVDCIKSAS
jgi:hypothetical protein